MSFPQTVADALVLARLAFERGVDILPPGDRQPVADTFEEYRRDPRGSLKRKEFEIFFNHSPSKQIEIEKDREVDSFLDGASRRIATKSAYLRKAALLILAFPPDERRRRPGNRWIATNRARAREPKQNSMALPKATGNAPKQLADVGRPARPTASEPGPGCGPRRKSKNQKIERK